MGGLLDSAFTLYRRNVRLILAITAVVQLPLALLSYLAYQLTGFASISSRLQQLGSGGTVTRQQLADLSGPLISLAAVGIALLLLQLLVVQPVATAAMARAVGDVYLEKPTSVGRAYGAVWHRVGSVIGVAAILFLVGLGLVFAGVALGAAAIVALGQAGLVVAVVLIFPGVLFAAILLYTRWLFAGPIVILEHAGATAALRRSWHLVRGSTPRVFGISLLVGLITGILGAIVAALLSVATGFGDENVRLVLNQFAQLVVAVVIQPISFIVVVLLYYDLRIRREAFDIEMLAADL